jgi:transposase InsO family protein
MRLPLLALTVLLQAIRALSRSRSDLVLENVALRQQIAVLHKRRGRPCLAPEDRAFWVALRHAWNSWADVLIFVKPETVVNWHRQAFRRYWRSISRPVGRPAIKAEIRQLIIRMASENPTWGAPRIHGELLKLGFAVSERTVSRYLRRRPERIHRAGEWLAFLRNHREVLAAMDFFTVPTATFRILYVWFVIHHDRRKILHFNVTEYPTAPWVIQQLRESFPYDTVPSYLVFDRDSIFAEKVVTSVRAMGIEPKRIAFRSPWQNGVAERWIGSCRRELLDRVIVLHARHLRRLLRAYVEYYSRDRCHLGLEKDAPDVRLTEQHSSRQARVVSLPRVGGLHRRYAWRHAA